MAILFVYRFVPETKGHSVEEITRIFDREAERGITASAAADAAYVRARPAAGPGGRGPGCLGCGDERALGLLDRPGRHVH